VSLFKKSRVQQKLERALKSSPVPLKPKAPPNPPPVRKEMRQPQVTITISSGIGGPSIKASGKPAKWVFSETATINGYVMTGGMLYVGEKLVDEGGYSNDACLIDPRLKVKRPGMPLSISPMGYWPRYAAQSEDNRARYLRWLASGRSGPVEEMGCLFLFFYGLERRLLIDGQKGLVSAPERESIVAEIRRLRSTYPSSGSFMSYSAGLLTAHWLLYGGGGAIPDYLTEGGSSIGVRVLLAQHSAEGKPLPPGLALRWLRLRPDYYKMRTPAKRCREEYERLFTIRYMQKFGEGLVVKPNKSRLTFQYGVASPSFRFNRQLINDQLPDPFMMRSPGIKKISELANECADELEGYSRIMGKPASERSVFAVAAKLPAPLAPQNESYRALRQTLLERCERGPTLMSIECIYEIFGETTPEGIGKKECDDLAALLEATGFGLAPDPRYHGIKIGAEGMIVVFPGGHGSGFKPSDEFRMMSTVVRLGALVSQSDEDVSGPEVELLKALIADNKQLKEDEKRSLRAFLLWSLGTPQKASGLKKAFESVGQDEKSAIGRILIAVAGADGRIEPQEVGQLEKLYQTLGLGRERVAADLHEVIATGGPVTIARAETETTHAIPKERPEAVFSLDKELVERLRDDTAKAKKVLGQALSAEEVPEPEPPASDEECGQSPLELLDAPYQELLKRLLAESEWEAEAIDSVCKELGLMTDGAMEELNEWAFEHAGAPLIDYGEPIFIDVELARGIMDDR
jgi:tellurite resistance protein